MTAQLADTSAEQRVSILFIDDEPRVLKSMRAMFRKDYDVHLANSGQEALDIIASQNIRVVVSDQRMPEMTGVEVLTEIKARSPATIRILLTGYADLAAVEASINEAEVYKYLMKPCPADEVRGAVAAGLEAATPSAEAEPAAQPPLAEVVQLEEMRPPKYRRSRRNMPSDSANLPEQPPSNEARSSGKVQQAPPPAAAVQHADVGVLVLSEDDTVYAAINALAGNKGSGKSKGAVKGAGKSAAQQIYRAASVEAAVAQLSVQAVGVLVADIGAEEQQITHLIEVVREVQPHIMIILVSDRSDASLLIQLINSGQIFRFLLKPLQSGQCKISLASARARYTEKVGDVPLLLTTADAQSGRWHRFKNWLLGI